MATGIQVMFGFLLIVPFNSAFRHHEKPYLVRVANELAIAAMVFLAFSFTGILLLVSDVVLGGLAPALARGASAVFITVLWFGLPLLCRGQERSARASSG
ncbi:MAG TPA: DUF6328 family protein [Solirubrobacteraceae bacterium]